MKHLLLTTIIFGFSFAQAQEKSYFYEAPNPPEKYTAENVAARMIDGLGFRYFWATEGLTPKDLAYQPNTEARTTRATLEHIYELSLFIRHSTEGLETKADAEVTKYEWGTLRNLTLENLKITSLALKKQGANLENVQLQYTGKNGQKNVYSFWYLIIGPIEDAVWHVGQIASFRRSSGNPLPNGVGFLQGKKY